MSGRTITSLCLVAEEKPTPIFMGREDGSVDYYSSYDAVSLDKPAMTFYGHLKAVTSILAPSVEEFFTCSMDGAVRQWTTDSEQDVRKRCIRVTKFSTPLRCLAIHEERLYTGGDDGCLHVIDNLRYSSWSGHKDALSCIAVVAEDSPFIVTGGYDNHIRLWDTTMGKTIRLLVGHQNCVKCLRIAADGQLLLSFGGDLTMRVWRLPDAEDVGEEISFLSSGETIRRATVSFKEPSDTKKSAAEVEEEATTTPLPDMVDEETPAADIYHATIQTVGAPKSALKSRPEPPIRQIKFVGIIGLPDTPLIIHARSEEARFCYVGTSSGYVLGINVHELAKKVLQFLSRNMAIKQVHGRGTRNIVRLAVIAIKKCCKKVIRERKQALIRDAKRMMAEKKAEEKNVRAAARASRTLARTLEHNKKEEEEEEEEEEKDGEENKEQEDEQQEEYEDLEEADDDDEERDPLTLLSDEQREELEAFRKAQEKERDDEIEVIQKAAIERSATLLSIAETVYITTREQFFRLSFTSYRKIGNEAVRALLVTEGSVCYIAQSSRLVRAEAVPGITYL